jgi:FXSXX-COOH protein
VEYPDGDIVSEVIDVSELTLEDLRSLGGSALGDALRRVIAETGDSSEPVSGFNSRI